MSQPARRDWPPAEALPRLLAGLGPDGGSLAIGDHLARWGAPDLRAARTDLVDRLEASGLVGHGGAAFPVATKWRSVGAGSRRRPVVVANGAEGEPASAKDALLIVRAPHLILDGASLAGAALGASRVVAYVPERLVPGVRRAVHDRRHHRLDPVEIEVVGAPDRFIAGQETAVVNVLNGFRAVPTFAGLQSIRSRGVGGQPTLVHNVETLAHVALIARFGARWFGALGTPQFPGTMLLTVTGRYERPMVVEAPLGAPLREVLQLSSGAKDEYAGALLGGYGGMWVSMSTLLDLELSETSARQHQAMLGPGVVVLLPRSVCPLAEVARVTRYLQEQGAGQCGPCVNGLEALAHQVGALAFHPKALRGRIDQVLELCGLVEGRGACRHPDGATRLVRSACSVFADEVARHLRHGPCELSSRPAFLPLPAPRAVHRGRQAAGVS